METAGFPEQDLTAGRTLTSTPSFRSFRVIWLTLVIIALSIADLYVTLLYLHSGGMGEGNPVARWLIAWDMPALLVMWKMLTVGLACGILLKYRRERLVELGAIACCLILVWLTIRWEKYHREVPELTGVLHTMAEHHSDKWVRMGE